MTPFAAALLEIPYPWLDPVALDLPGPIDLRWYGLSYLAAFGVGYLILKWLARERFLRLDQEQVGDLLVALIVGVFLGGRVGYILFYDFSSFAANPIRIFKVWEGGMSFHGGFIGVILAAVWFVRTRRASFLELGDSVVLATPLGIFFVRCANFINGELYGRVTDQSVPWAMRFPTDPVALRLLGADRADSMRGREQIISQAYESGSWQAVRDQVPLRHPSQLYQGLTEGLLVAVILWLFFWWTRKRGWRPPHGTFGALFLLLYGSFRLVTENFRQPDAQFRGPGDPLGTVLGPLTMGQVLSALMLLGGIGLLVWLWRRAATLRAPGPG